MLAMIAPPKSSVCLDSVAILGSDVDKSGSCCGGVYRFKYLIKGSQKPKHESWGLKDPWSLLYSLANVAQVALQV